MATGSITSSFRFKLIVPVALALSGAILAAIIFIIVTQNRGNVQLNALIAKAFNHTGQEINGNLTSLADQLEDKLKAMNSSDRTLLSDSSRDSLHKAAESMSWRMRKMYESSAENFALLLSQVSQPAVIAKDSIQHSTNDTVSEISLISKVINDVNEIVTAISLAIEEQSATTSEITRNVTEAAEGIASVNNNVAQSSIVAGEIAKDINEVSRLAANSRQCSERVEVGSQRLNTVVVELQNETGKFKLNVPPGQTKKSA